MIELDLSDDGLSCTLSQVVHSIAEPRARIVVSDRFDRPCDVLVVPVTPLACARAVHALLAGRTTAVLCADELDRLPAVLEALARSWAPLPRRVRDTATLVTPLSDREHAVVRAATMGRPLRDEAAELGVSEATVKRDLRAALARLGVTDREDLAAFDR